MPKKLPPFHARMWAMVKRNPVKSISAVLGILAAYPGGMAGAAFIGNQIEPNWVATHTWVRERIQDELKPIVTAQAGDRTVLRDLQLDGANKAKRDEARNLADWTLKRSSAKDSLTIELIDKQINDSKQAVEALDSQIRTLKALKDQGK